MNPDDPPPYDQIDAAIHVEDATAVDEVDPVALDNPGSHNSEETAAISEEDPLPVTTLFCSGYLHTCLRLGTQYIQCNLLIGCIEPAHFALIAKTTNNQLSFEGEISQLRDMIAVSAEASPGAISVQWTYISAAAESRWELLFADKEVYLEFSRVVELAKKESARHQARAQASLRHMYSLLDTMDYD